MTRNLLMIPGPVEVDSQVLAVLAEPQAGHVSPSFIETFGECLDDLREIFAAPDGQPFVVAGSGTLAMEMAVANLIEPGMRAVVVSSGYFAGRMAEILQRHGAQVELVAGEIGDVPTLGQVEAALRGGARLLAATQVDTSTGVLAPVPELAALGRRYGALVVVDGVCSVAGQELRQTDWDIDVCLTASQKALAAPPGLALVMARPRALEAFQARQAPVGSYYADWGKWLPVMQAYQARKPAYFATPAVNLVKALGRSLQQIKREGMENVWQRHLRLSQAFKAGIQALGIEQVPLRPDVRAATLTTMYYPGGYDASLVGKIAAQGVIVAGGLLPQIAARTFRVGHMGVDGIGDVLRTLAAIETALGQPGVAVAAAQQAWAGV
jgi:alanine-glyoxylate transaminase/serine-glyoxylate transaminase/serine-pyruvate transaminase